MKVTWPAVALVGLIIGGLVILGALNRDTTQLVWLGLAVLSSAGLVSTLAVKEQTNGRITQLVEVVERQGAMLAAAQPPPATDPAAPSNLGRTAEEEHGSAA